MMLYQFTFLPGMRQDSITCTSFSLFWKFELTMLAHLMAERAISGPLCYVYVIFINIAQMFMLFVAYMVICLILMKLRFNVFIGHLHFSFCELCSHPQLNEPCNCPVTGSGCDFEGESFYLWAQVCFFVKL